MRYACYYHSFLEEVIHVTLGFQKLPHSLFPACHSDGEGQFPSLPQLVGGSVQRSPSEAREEVKEPVSKAPS